MRRALWAGLALVAGLCLLSLVAERRRPALRFDPARVTAASWSAGRGRAARGPLPPRAVARVAAWVIAAQYRPPAEDAPPCTTVPVARVMLRRRGGGALVTGPVILCGPAGHRTVQVLVTVGGHTFDLNAPALARWLRARAGPGSGGPGRAG